MNKTPKKPTPTSWGGVADWYDDLLSGDDDSYQKQVILPNLTRIVEPTKGMVVLDVACGQGYFTRVFSAAGAHAIGCDISMELIEKAQKQEAGSREHGGNTIEYYVAPADSLSMIESGSVDVVTIVLALQNIENLAGTIGEASRVLKMGGRLVFVINHPAFRIPGRSAWGEDDKKDDTRMYRRIDAYMSDSRTEIDMTPGEIDITKKKRTMSFHRPLQSYFKSLNKSGLSVTRLEEWISHKVSQPGPRATEEDRMRKEIPMFMCVETRKG